MLYTHLMPIGIMFILTAWQKIYRRYFVLSKFVVIFRRRHVIFVFAFYPLIVIFLLTCAPRRSIVIQFFWSARKCIQISTIFVCKIVGGVGGEGIYRN